MDNTLSYREFNLITDFYATRIIDKINLFVEKHQNNINNFGFLIVELKNFNNILYLYGNVTAYKYVNQLGIKLQNNNEFEVEVINHNHYLILMNNCNEDNLKIISNEIFSQIHSFGFTLSENVIYFHPAIGGTITNNENINPINIINECIIALDNVKNTTFYYKLYSELETDKEQIKNEMKLANFLHKTLFYNKVHLAYQPVVCSKTKKVFYYESLLRLVNENGESKSVGPYIPIAEKYGFINLIDEISLNLVIDNLINYPDISLSFNLSGLCINNDNFLQKIINILKINTGISNRLIIEITETAILKDVPKASRLISKLQELGCQVALDDFGAGYHSFKNIQELKINILKIDGGFIRNIETSESNKIFVDTFINVSKRCNVKSVAEFVENKNIEKLLIDLGVDFLQGNFISPALELEPWKIKDNNSQIKNG